MSSLALNTLTPEQIQRYKKRLETTKPYTEEEINNIPFDSPEFDFDRSEAYMAKKALQKAGLLKE